MDTIINPWSSTNSYCFFRCETPSVPMLILEAVGSGGGWSLFGFFPKKVYIYVYILYAQMPLNWRYMFHGYLVEPCSSSRSEVCPFSIVTRSLLSKYMDSLQLQKARRQNPYIFMESPLVHGTAYMVLSFIVIVLFALVHARLTKLDVFSALKRFEQWRQQEKAEVTQKQLDQERRYEELLRTRMQILTKLNKILIHIGFAQICVALPHLLHDASFSSLAEFTALVLAYSWHAFAETKGAGNHMLVHCWTALFCMIHILIFASSVNSEDSIRLSITEKLCGLCSIMMLGVRWLVFHLAFFRFSSTRDMDLVEFACDINERQLTKNGVSPYLTILQWQFGE